MAGVRVGVEELERAAWAAAGGAARDLAVVGGPDAVGGQVPVGWVVLAPGAAAPDLLRRWRESARDAVGGHAEPGAVVAVPALPKTATGKTQRGLLQASLEGKAALRPARARTAVADAGAYAGWIRLCFALVEAPQLAEGARRLAAAVAEVQAAARPKSA